MAESTKERILRMALELFAVLRKQLLCHPQRNGF